MYFFRSREDADVWAEGRGGVAIFSIAEGDELAQQHWVERLRRARDGDVGERSPPATS